MSVHIRCTARSARVTRTLAFIAAAASMLLQQGCMSVVPSYEPPATAVPVAPTAVDIERSVEDAWTRLIRGLGTTTMDILLMDKQTGFVSVGFAGDPEQYVNGGILVYTVKIGTDHRTIRIPASKADTTVTLTALAGQVLIHRQVVLEGKMNIVVRDVAHGRTHMTVNIRYTLLITTEERAPDADPVVTQEEVTFTTGSHGRSLKGVLYQSNGRLEEAVVALTR